MARLSFEKKRAPGPAAHPAAVPVRVYGAGGASVGGTAVVAEPGEEIQQAVLNHLQRLAISLGAPIRATIQDDRAGCVVPLEVSADGSSRVTGKAVRVAPAESPEFAPSGRSRTPRGAFGPAPVMAAPASASPVPAPASPAPASASSAPAPASPASVPAVPLPAVPAASAVPVVPPPAVSAASAVPAVPAPGVSSVPDAPASAVPVPVVEGPEPLTDVVVTAGPPASEPPITTDWPTESSAPTTATPTPPRGFDAVAEEVLGDGPVTETREGAELLTEPMTRINEAVRAGRIEAAAELVEHTVEEASTVLGARHAEVLHLRELAAYIAYLAGEPVRACQLSLDLARLRRTAGDAEAAYGNVQSASTAWRAVRDPEEGLRLGRDLIDLWTDLAAEPGPAADDPRPLESARARMLRLTDRAARAAG
ncbi:tetratricopeptide repeat protein [Streptomyces misionensis]|uniref:tetratricopeptide repeat protein n=1 Tax=Streptomyces misionensis TaxID=67331 RepID=UPI0036F8A524